MRVIPLYFMQTVSLMQKPSTEQFTITDLTVKLPSTSTRKKKKYVTEMPILNVINKF